MDFTDVKITTGLYRCQDLKKFRETEIIIFALRVAFPTYYGKVALTFILQNRLHI